MTVCVAPRNDYPDGQDLCYCFATSNFDLVMSCLEIALDDRGFGEIDPEQLLSAVEIARHYQPAEVPTTDFQKPGQARIIQSGISEERWNLYFDYLARIARYAKAHGVKVGYS